MVKKDQFYLAMYGRSNTIKNELRAIAFGMSSYPRLILEIFLRHDMGIRNFSLYHCIRFFIILAILPFLVPTYYEHRWYNVLLSNWGWYAFLVAFGKFSWDRYKECKRPHGFFDFNHFSKSSGRRLPQVNMFKFRGKLLNDRTLDVYVEPLLATAVGLLAFLLGQWMLGTLLTVCGGIYSMSYKWAYDLGRNLLLNKIDEDIFNRNLTNSFLNDKPETSNFRMYCVKPSTAEARQGFAELFSKDDEGVEVH